MAGMIPDGADGAGWFLPSLYLRPRYMWIVTPLGSVHIDAPPQRVVWRAAGGCVYLLDSARSLLVLEPKRIRHLAAKRRQKALQSP